MTHDDDALVEAMARASWHSSQQRIGGKPLKWGNMSVFVRTAWLDDERAALAALREMEAGK